MADANLAFVWVMESEDDPRHPGVVTDEPDGAKARLGINSHAHPEMPESFWSCSYEEALPQAEKIFKEGYFDGLEGISSQMVANKIADIAYNCGVATAHHMVYDILGFHRVPGEVVVGQINSRDSSWMLNELRAHQHDYYANLVAKNPVRNKKYEKNWLARAAR